MAGSVADAQLIDSVTDGLRVSEAPCERDPADPYVDARSGIGVSKPLEPFGEFVCLQNL